MLIRWAVHVSGVGIGTLEEALRREMLHYLETSPILTSELDQINQALRMSYNGPSDITHALRDARSKMLHDSPHPATPQLEEQMSSCITAAVAMASLRREMGRINVSLSGAINALLGDAVPEARIAATFGDRITIAMDFVVDA